MTVETKLEGEPTAINDAAAWLRGRFASEASSAGDTVVEQRRGLASDWQGSAGEAFGGRRDLGRAADTVANVARAAARRSRPSPRRCGRRRRRWPTYARGPPAPDSSCRAP